MPLWVVYHPPGTFADDETKHAFARDVTGYYTSRGLPAFYVVVQFIEQPFSDTWIGGEKKDNTKPPFIRITADHIAATLPQSDEIRKRAVAELDLVLKPHIADKGYDWEYHIDETDRRLWKINGVAPPPHPSEEEKVWFKENRVVHL